MCCGFFLRIFGFGSRGVISVKLFGSANFGFLSTFCLANESVLHSLLAPLSVLHFNQLVACLLACFVAADWQFQMFLPFATIRDNPSRPTPTSPTRRGCYLCAASRHSTLLCSTSVSTFKLANLMSCTSCFRPTHAQAIVIWSLAVKLVCNMAHVRGRAGGELGWCEWHGIRLAKQVTRVTRAHFWLFLSTFIFILRALSSVPWGPRVLEKDLPRWLCRNDEKDSQQYRIICQWISFDSGFSNHMEFRILLSSSD